MLEKLMEVLSLFSNTRHELTVGEIAELLERPKSTVSGWLAAMESAGFLERDGRFGAYRLSIRLAVLGELAQRSTSLQQSAESFLEQLARQTKETVSLNVLMGAEVVNVAGVESRRAIRQAGGVGIPMPIHVTAAGKVMMAWRSREEVLSLLPLRLERFTSRTIVEQAEFLEQLEQVRTDGYAVAWGEMADDLFAVSAPVRNHTAEVVAAITMGAPLSRIDRAEIPQLARLVADAADGVSRRMGCPADALPPADTNEPPAAVAV